MPLLISACKYLFIKLELIKISLFKIPTFHSKVRVYQRKELILCVIRFTYGVL